MYLPTYRPSKAWSRHSLRGAVSKHPSTVNKLNRSKHKLNLPERTFTIFFNHSEDKWFGKHLPDWSLESQGCLLTHGVPITSIVFRIVWIYRSLFKSSYLKNQEHFLSFLFHLRNLHQILNIFQKKKIFIANIFAKLATV